MVLNFFIRFTNFILEKINIFIIYRFGNARGDQLLMSGVVDIIKKKYNYKIIILTKYPEFFLNNPYIYKVFFFSNKNFIHKIFYKIFKKLNFKRIKEFEYCSNKNENLKIFDLCNYQDIHLAEYHSKNLDLDLNFSNFNNSFFFSDEELLFFNKKFKLPERFSVIQPYGKTSFTKNKEWDILKFQGLLNSLPSYNWVQIGFDDEKRLENTNIFFQNLNLRELFFIIYKCEFLVCLEGLYNHIGNCFKKKTFLILSGFLHEKNITYSNNIIIKKFDNLSCYPCYKIYDCDISGKPCTNNIMIADVVKVINSNCF